MSLDILEAKKQLRKSMLQLRQAIPVDQKKSYDNWICEKLYTEANLLEAKIIHAYLPFKEEINIYPLLSRWLKEGKKIICPKTLPARKLENRVLHSLDNLEEGIMKTFHPKEKEVYEGNYDLILVPGLAFDENNYRLGYGGGYYDQFLSQNQNAFSIGIFYPFQKTISLPVEKHDTKLRKVIYQKA